MKEKTIFLYMFILLTCLSIGKVIAQPTPPCAFYGNVYVGGKLAQDGLTVTAQIRGTSLNWTTQTKKGTYGEWSNFYVPAENADSPQKDGGVAGDTIEFYVQGIKTGQVATFSSGDAIDLDLSISGLPGTPIQTFLKVSVDCLSTFAGYKAKISGELAYTNGTGISGANLTLTRSVSGGALENSTTNVITSTNGNYYTEWALTPTGNYLIKVSWEGDKTLNVSGTETSMTLAAVPLEEKYVFSVISNSTVSELVFNSSSKVLGFTVSGPADTTGYANITIAKDLIGDITQLKVFLDGNQIPCKTASTDDSWMLSLTYQHSTHRVTVDLNSTGLPFFATPLGTVTIIAITAAIMIAMFMTYTRLQQRRKSKNYHGLHVKQAH
jgi:hypothetical protein